MTLLKKNNKKYSIENHFVKNYFKNNCFQSLEKRKSVLYLHSQYRNRLRYWRVGRVVECGSLENC